MVRAWYIDSVKGHPRDEHHRLPPKFITLEDLYTISGVQYQGLNVDCYGADLEKIKKDRGFSYEDEIETPDEDFLKMLYAEHLHQDDEIRFVLEGCAYYDFRDVNNEWIRLEVLPGDLIIIPGGCYHRFTLDHKNNFRAIRLFLNNPYYQAFKRPDADNLTCRKVYVQKLKEGAFAEENENELINNS